MDRRGLVSISPQSYLQFDFEPNKKQQTEVMLKNNSDEVFEFKVKLTHIEIYSVSPTHGSIKPGETVSIKIVLKAVEGIGSKTHKFEFAFSSKNSNSPPFSHRLKADFGAAFAKHSPRKSALKEQAMGETIIEEAEISYKETSGLDDTLSKLREELTKAEHKKLERTDEQTLATDEKPVYTKKLMFIYFAVGLFLGAFVFN